MPVNDSYILFEFIGVLVTVVMMMVIYSVYEYNKKLHALKNGPHQGR